MAQETADVALMADDLARLPFAVGLGREVRRVIRQNLLVSLGVLALPVRAAALGVAGIAAAIVFHEGSTLVVVGQRPAPARLRKGLLHLDRRAGADAAAADPDSYCFVE